MLQSKSGTTDLSFISNALELPAKFGALGKTGGSERMALGNEAAAWVYYAFGSSVGKVTLIDRLSGFTWFAKPNGLISTEFVCREAVVEFDDVDLVRVDASLLVNLLGAVPGHVSADNIHRTFCFKARGLVSRHGDALDLNCLVLQVVGQHELLAAENGTCSPI